MTSHDCKPRLVTVMYVKDYDGLRLRDRIVLRTTVPEGIRR